MDRTKRVRKTLLLGIVAVSAMASLSGCGHLSSSEAPARSVALAELAAGVSAPQGFADKAGPEFFNQENLYKAINGMAPEYISYGCEALAMISWTPAEDAGGEKLQLEIYDMGSPLGAYGIYSRAHTGAGDFVDLNGTEAAVAEDIVEYARGRFYVRVLGYFENTAPLMALARSLVEMIPSGPPPESLLRRLPEENRIPRTDRWIPDAAFGMEFMKNVEVARYSVGGEELELYVAPFEDKAAAMAGLDRFHNAVAGQKPASVERPFPGFQYEDKWIGSVGVFRIDAAVVVVSGYRESPATVGLLDGVEDRLAR